MKTATYVTPTLPLALLAVVLVSSLVVSLTAPHAFTVFGSAAYRVDADGKSWRRFKEFLTETLTVTDAEAPASEQAQ
jgi:hypothetical protein